MLFLLSNFIKFHTWKKYSHVDHARRACVTAYPNMVTKSQRFAKSTWFLGKKNHKTKCCYVKNIVTCLWMFWKEFDGEKNLRIWPLKYGTFFRLSSSETHLLDTASVLQFFLKMAACCSRFAPATKCCCVKAQSAVDQELQTLIFRPLE